MQTNNQVPVTVLTGFLGAGKTTHVREKGAINRSPESTVHRAGFMSNLNVAMNAAIIYDAKSHLKTEAANLL